MSILCDPKAGRAIYNVTNGGLVLAESDDIYCAVLGWPREKLIHMDPIKYKIDLVGNIEGIYKRGLGHCSGRMVMPRAMGGASEIAWEAIRYMAKDGEKIFIAAQYASFFCHI